MKINIFFIVGVREYYELLAKDVWTPINAYDTYDEALEGLPRDNRTYKIAKVFTTDNHPDI